MTFIRQLRNAVCEASSIYYRVDPIISACNVCYMNVETEIVPHEITLGELIQQRTDRLTPSERRVARVLFATNLMAGFDTVAELAERAQVSGPTVVRFARSRCSSSLR